MGPLFKINKCGVHTRLQQETADNLKSMSSEQQIISAHHLTNTCMMCGGHKTILLNVNRCINQFLNQLALYYSRTDSSANVVFDGREIGYLISLILMQYSIRSVR